jgi:DNA-binding MarR family transcriptional regulator
VNRLAANGLIERVRAGGDRRVVRLRLTATGEQKLRTLSDVHRDELLSTGPNLVRELSGLLARLNSTPMKEKDDFIPQA